VFNTLINSGSLQSEFITIQNSNDTRVSGTAFTLSSAGSTVSPDGRSITIVLAADDVLALGTDDRLATSRGDTFMAVSGNAFEDLLGRTIVPLIQGRALQVTTYVADTTAPTITFSRLDLSANEIHLSFSEAVNVSSLQTSSFELRGSQSLLAPARTLTGGILTFSSDARFVTITLVKPDSDALRSTPGVGTFIHSGHL
jgi:hypothetical protein